MNGTIFRFLLRWPARRFKFGASLLAFGLTGWLAAQHGSPTREPAARLLAPQPIRGQELVARGLAPQYSSFPSLPPTGRISQPILPKKDATSNTSWVFGPSGPPPTYLFGRSNKTNPISTEQPRLQQQQQQQSSSYLSSAWSSMKNLVVGSPLPTPTNVPTPPSSRPVSGFGFPTQQPGPVPPTTFPTADSGIYAREPAYRWYGWGTTTPGTNPLAPNGQYPQASSNWYVQSGATPGAIPAPAQPIQLTEHSAESPRYPGNPVFGPQVTSGPTLWMNAASANFATMPAMPTLPPQTLTPPPSVVMVPAPQLPPVTIVVPPQPPAVAAPVFQPAPMPTFTPASAAPRVDVLPGLTPASKPNKEPMPSVPVPPREFMNPAAEIERLDTKPPVVQGQAKGTHSAPVVPKWASARPEPRSEPLVASRPAIQAPSRQTAVKPAPSMPPMPDFGPSAVPATGSPGKNPPEPIEPQWTQSTPKQPASTPQPRPAAPPPSLAFQPARVPAPELPPSPVEPLTALPAERTSQAVWQQSSNFPQPVRPVRAEMPAPMTAPVMNLEQQIRSAAGFAVKILEVRQSTPVVMIVSFLADSEGDARAAAEAISKLPALKPFNVSFNARITGK